MERTVAVPAGTAGERAVQILKLVVVLAALTAFNTMSIDMYLPAFPAMSRDLHASPGTVQLSIPAFLFGSAASQVFYGPLADRFGRKRPLFVGLWLYVIASAGCALVHSGTGLLLWRVLMALGGGASIVISRAIVRDLYDTTDAARMLSLLMLVIGVSPILAPIAGGQLLLITGWRGIFAVLTVFGLLSLYWTLAWLPESLPEERRVPRRFREMMAIYGELLRTRSFLGYALALGAVAGLFFAYIAAAPQFFIELHGISPQAFGIYFGINAAGLIGAAQLNRRLLRHHSARAILAAAFPLASLTALLLTLATVTGFGGFAVQALLIFCFVSIGGILFPNVMALGLDPYASAAGSASALLGMVQYSLGALAGVFVGIFHNGSALPMVLTMTGCALAGSLAFLYATREAELPASCRKMPMDADMDSME